MGYAPHHNGQLYNEHGQCKPRVLGRFDEKEYGHTFEFSERFGFDSDRASDFAPDFPHLVYVGNDQNRVARVLKTVAYIVIDEDEDGNPVTEKWNLRNHTDYE